MMDFTDISAVVVAIGRTSPAGVQLLGTAFALGKPGFLGTASHVVGTDDTNLVIVGKPLQTLHDYQDTSDQKVHLMPVKIHASDPFHDLVVLKAKSLVFSQLKITGADAVKVGTPVSSFGYPHADHGRMVLTQQDSSIGARILIESGGIKAKHVVLNTQARPGQSGSPVFRRDTGELVAVLVGSYAPGGGGEISLGGVDPHTLHQTTHAVSCEYLLKMY
jgi:S1-C subfamily serine protease